MKNILVPTDFSKEAEVALDFVLQSSGFLPAKIILLHSFEVVDNLYVDYFGFNKEFNQDVIHEATRQLARKQEEIREKYGIAVEVVVDTDDLQKSISRTVKEKGIDLIVMGTQGAGNAVEKLVGSHTSKIIGTSTVPVLAIPAQYVWRKPETILLATRDFERSDKILNFIFELADLYLAGVRVTVFTDEEWDSAGIYQKNQKSLEDYEAFLKQTYKEEALDSIHLLGTDFGKAVEDYILNNEIDILTMVTRGTGFWKRLFNPSITRKMSFHSLIPLLAIPADFS